MAKTLKEIFGLREVSVNVPDADAPALRRLIDIAIEHGQLPPEARAWMSRDKGGAAASASPLSAPEPSPKAKTNADQSQSAWDALAGTKTAPSAKPKSTAKTKASIPAQKPVDPTASWAAPKSANVQLGPEPEDDSAPYKSPFAWNQIDPDNTRGDDLDVPDEGPGTFRSLPQQKPKGPGLAGRAAAGIKNAFRGKPSDGRKELDKALKAADKHANTKQGTLSRLFKGKDVTRGQGS